MHKHEVLESYKLFEALIKTQHDRPIKMIQFDNGKEYVNKDFKEHLEKQGTQYHMMSLHTPAQNGIAEHLN